MPELAEFFLGNQLKSSFLSCFISSFVNRFQKELIGKMKVPAFFTDRTEYYTEGGLDNFLNHFNCQQIVNLHVNPFRQPGYFSSSSILILLKRRDCGLASNYLSS